MKQEQIEKLASALSDLRNASSKLTEIALSIIEKSENRFYPDYSPEYRKHLLYKWISSINQIIGNEKMEGIIQFMQKIEKGDTRTWKNKKWIMRNLNYIDYI